MFSLFLLLMHLALYNVAYGTLDIGPARVDVDVFMSLDHQTSSIFSAAAFTATTTITPESDALTEYSETTHSPLHPYSKVTSYIGSAWDELGGALGDSETSTPITDLDSSTTSFTVTTTTTSKSYASSEHVESTQSSLHPYSRVTSYVGSAWDELNSALRDSETSTSTPNFASVATSSVVDEATCSETLKPHSSQSWTDLPSYPHSAHPMSTRAYDGSLTAPPSLFAPSTGFASCSTYSGGLSDSNGTGVWEWPPVVSAWPSSSTHSGNSNHSNSPIVQSGMAEGKPTGTMWGCCLVGASLLGVEAWGML